MSAKSKHDALYDYFESLYMRACDRGMGLEFAARCVSEVVARVESGRGFDCDEYRALAYWASLNFWTLRIGNPGALPPVLYAHADGFRPESEEMLKWDTREQALEFRNLLPESAEQLYGHRFLAPDAEPVRVA